MTAHLTFVDPTSGQRTRPTPLSKNAASDVTLGGAPADFTPAEIHRIADQVTRAVMGGLLVITTDQPTPNSQANAE